MMESRRRSGGDTPMLTHEQAEMLISERIDGPLDAVDQRTLDLHLAGCPSCRHFASSLGVMGEGLRELPRLPASPTVARRVRERIAQPAGIMDRLGRLFGGQLGLAPVAATAVLLVAVVAGALLLNGRGDGTADDDNPTVLASTLEADDLTETSTRATTSPDVAVATGVVLPTSTPERTPLPNITFQEPSATSVPADTATPTEEPTETPVPEPTETPVPEPTETVPPAPDAAATTVATATDVATSTATTEPTATDVPTETATPVPPTDTPEPTETATEQPTETSLPEPTDTPEPTDVPTRAPTETTEPTSEPTETPTEEPAASPTAEPTESIQPTIGPIDGGPVDGDPVDPADDGTVVDGPTEAPTETPADDLDDDGDGEPPIEPIDGTSIAPDDGDPEGDPDGDPDGDIEGTGGPVDETATEEVFVDETPDDGGETPDDDTDTDGDPDDTDQDDPADVAGGILDKTSNIATLPESSGAPVGELAFSPTQDLMVISDASGQFLQVAEIQTGAVVQELGAGQYPEWSPLGAILMFHDLSDGSTVNTWFRDGNDFFSLSDSDVEEGGYSDVPAGWFDSTAYYLRVYDSGRLSLRAYDAGSGETIGEVWGSGAYELGGVRPLQTDAGFLIPTTGAWLLVTPDGGEQELAENSLGPVGDGLLSPDGSLVAVSGSAGLYLVDAFTGDVVGQLPYAEATGAGFSWSPDGGLIAISDGGSINVYTRDGEAVGAATSDDGVTIAGVQFQDDGIYFVQTSGMASLRRFDLARLFA